MLLKKDNVRINKKCKVIWSVNSSMLRKTLSGECELQLESYDTILHYPM